MLFDVLKVLHINGIRYVDCHPVRIASDLSVIFVTEREVGEVGELAGTSRGIGVPSLSFFSSADKEKSPGLLFNSMRGDLTITLQNHYEDYVRLAGKM